jgi:hypothetical protein
MSGDSKPREANESITFRLKPSIIRGLRKEAEGRGITLNTLITQILSHYLDWDMTAAKAGYIPIPRPLMTLVLSDVTDGKAADIGSQIANHMDEIMLVMRGGVSTDALVTQLKLWLREADMPNTMTYSDSKLTWVIHHEMGSKWSVFFARAIEDLFYRLDQKKIGTEYTENAVVLKIET